MRFLIALLAQLRDLRHADDGGTAVEYALMATLIAVVIVGIVTTIGLEVVGMFGPIAPAL